MNNAEKVYIELKFLEEYSFQNKNQIDGREFNISFFNDSGCFTYHCYPQFGDFNIFISNSYEDYIRKEYVRVYSADWIIENILPYRQKREDGRKDFDILDLVSFYIKKEIKEKGMFFDINVD